MLQLIKIIGGCKSFRLIWNLMAAIAMFHVSGVLFLAREALCATF